MTNPFPTVTPGQVIQDPGLGLGNGITQFLVAMQQQKENEYRQQQLMTNQQLAQQQGQYQQGQLDVQRGTLSMQTTEQTLKTAANAQVGAAQRAALGGGQPQAQAQAVPSQPTMQPQGQGVFKEILGGAAGTLAPSQGNPDIFGGVSNENMPAAVTGVQDVLKMQEQPQPDAGTTDMQNFQAWTKLAGVDPRDPQSVALFKRMIEPKQGTTVNVGQGEGAFDKQYNEEQAKSLAEVEKTALRASNGATGMAESYRLVGKAFTGAGAGAKLNVARMAIALGVAPDSIKQAAGDTQTLMKLTGDRVLDLMASRALGSGTAVSDTDLRFSQELSGRDLTKEPTALKKTIRINMGAAMMMQQDAVDHLREQAGFSSPQTAKQLLTKANALEGRLGKQWMQYATMLRDEGESVEQTLDRMPPRVQEQVASQVRKMYGGQGGLLGEAAKIPGVVMPGAQ